MTLYQREKKSKKKKFAASHMNIRAGGQINLDGWVNIRDSAIPTVFPLSCEPQEAANGLDKICPPTFSY